MESNIKQGVCIIANSFIKQGINKNLAFSKAWNVVTGMNFLTNKPLIQQGEKIALIDKFTQSLTVEQSKMYLEIEQISDAQRAMLKEESFTAGLKSAMLILSQSIK